MELGRLLRCALTLISGSASVLCLRCSMCTVRDGIDQAVTADNLRIITDVRKPYCTSGHEEVECSSGQDTCMTIVVHMPDNGKYWLAKGCTRSRPARSLPVRYGLLQRVDNQYAQLSSIVVAAACSSELLPEQFVHPPFLAYLIDVKKVAK
ncbi:conserved hypothetical protein [Trichinella spiralis]|uniref:hypothetical protein n=1 Tax=Trichinella spiralis TaxID=6334 RepID=UPI0001EFD431|nr:conserved hypothetical protein [Trichinella spiralis]